MVKESINAKLKSIRTRIEQGLEIEPHRHRKSIDQDHDGVLNRTGIMHLRLGTPPHRD